VFIAIDLLTLSSNLYSEDVYNELKDALLERLNDKEPFIRAHSIIALSKLVGTEETDELGDGEQTVLDTLLETVSTDPAAYVPF